MLSDVYQCSICWNLWCYRSLW